MKIDVDLGGMRLVSDTSYYVRDELTGYEVADLSETLGKAKAAGATVLVEPFSSRGRQSSIIQFPGGYIAEIHAVSGT